MLTLLLTPLSIESPMNYSAPVAAVKEPEAAIYSEPNNDGIYMSKTGKVMVGKQSPYELWGLSITEVSGEITFRVKSNLPLKGLPESRAKAGHIGYGDFLLYYRDTVAGIRLTGKDQGIYYNVKTVNNAKLHFGNKTPQEYIKRLKQAKAYEPNMQFPPEWVTHIKSGSLFSKNIKVTEAKKDGYYLITVTTQRNLLPKGSFIAYLPTECINDYVAGVYPLTGDTKVTDDGGGPTEPPNKSLVDSSLPSDPVAFSMSNVVAPVETAMLGETAVATTVLGSSAGAIGAGAAAAVAAAVTLNKVLNQDQSAQENQTNATNVSTDPEIIIEATPTPTPNPIPTLTPTPNPTPTLTPTPNPTPTLTPTPDPTPTLTPSPYPTFTPTPNPTPDPAVPEPGTILGTALATGIGVLFKRRRNQSVKK